MAEQFLPPTLAIGRWTVADLTVSSRAKALGLKNQAPAGLLPNAKRIAALVEDIERELGVFYGREVRVIPTSVYRAPKVNSAVGGSVNPPSAHMDFRAFDFQLPGGCNIADAFEALVASKVPFDKLILETDGRSTWIHAQVNKDAAARPRRQVLTGTKGPNSSAFKRVS